jgi:predicted transcriptional regulator
MSEGTTTLTVELPVEVKERLDALAKTTSSSNSRLATDAIRIFVDLQEWQVKEIREGLRAAEAGEFASDEEVAAVFAKRLHAR